jgi:hypothetical protein
MFVSCGGVLLGLVVLTRGMVVGRLVVMVSRSTVVGGSVMVVLMRRMLALFGHGRSPFWLCGGASVSISEVNNVPPRRRLKSATLVPSSRI